jgi:hypothetical protein
MLTHKTHKIIFVQQQSQVIEQNLPSFHHPLLVLPINNTTMVRDIASSHLHIASCYEDSEDSKSEMMKRPLITTTQSSDESLEADEGQTRLEQAKQQDKAPLPPDKGLLCQAFLLGSTSGFLLEGVSLATWCVIFKIWGQNATFSGALSLVSYWMLVLLSNIFSRGIFICFWLVFFYGTTKSGSLHLREKLDQDAEDTPAGSKLIWSASRRRLFVVGIYFVFGFYMGALSVSTIVHLCMGVADRFMAVPYVENCALFWLLLKCVECEQKTRGEEQAEQEEEKEEEDNYYSFHVACC